MQVDEDQAEAIADALLQPHVRQQHVRHLKNMARMQAAQRQQAIARCMAWCALAGGLLGGVIGAVAGFPLARAVFIGGLVCGWSGALIKWIRTAPRPRA